MKWMPQTSWSDVTDVNASTSRAPETTGRPVDRFVFAGACTRGDRGATDGAACEEDVDFNSGIAAGVEDLPRLNVIDGAHFKFYQYQNSCQPERV